MFSKAEVEYLHLHLIRNLRNQGNWGRDVVRIIPTKVNVLPETGSLLLEKAIARFRITLKTPGLFMLKRDIQAGQKAGVKQ